jgi:penicillin-binding protein 1A
MSTPAALGRYAGTAAIIMCCTTVLAVGAAVRLTADLRAFAWSVDIAPARQSTVLLDRHGRETFTIREINRTNVSLDELSPWVAHAVVAAEDRRFYRHSGIDGLAMARAALANARAGRIVQGASSITQQLARMRLEDRTRTYRRKLREMVVALELERRFTKHEILEAYLNTIYFGNGYYGVAAAAAGYFGKAPREIDPADAATLAALIPAPVTLSQPRSADQLRARRNRILMRMREAGVLPDADWELARKSVLAARLKDADDEANPPERERWGGYFKEAVRQQLVHVLGARPVRDGGLRVYTTLDADAQQAAERAVATQAAAIDRRASRGRRAGTPQPVQAALVALDPASGEVRALVGGRDFNTSPFDRARQARRQPGSTFKPLIAAAALEAGLLPGTMLKELAKPVPTLEGEWLPDGEHESSQMTVRQALVRSSNRASVRMLQDVGLSRALNLARRVGIESPLPSVPSLALGTGEVALLELATAYAPFANGGSRIVPTFITRVEDSAGQVLFRASRTPNQAIRRSTALLITHMLSDVVTRGTANAVKRLGFRGAAAGKTGTTDDFTDAWFIGYTPELLTGVWIGHDAPQQILARGFGGRLAVPLWTTFMKEVGETRAKFPPLEGFQQVRLCLVSGQRANEYCRLPPVEPVSPWVPGGDSGVAGVSVQIASDAGVYYDWVPKGSSSPPCPIHGPSSDDLSDGHVVMRPVLGSKFAWGR